MQLRYVPFYQRSYTHDKDLFNNIPVIIFFPLLVKICNRIEIIHRIFLYLLFKTLFVIRSVAPPAVLLMEFAFVLIKEAGFFGRKHNNQS